MQTKFAHRIMILNLAEIFLY